MMGCMQKRQWYKQDSHGFLSPQEMTWMRTEMKWQGPLSAQMRQPNWIWAAVSLNRVPSSRQERKGVWTEFTLRDDFDKLALTQFWRRW